MPAPKPREKIPGRLREPMEWLNHPDWQKREDAAEILGNIGGPRVVPHLVKALQDDVLRVKARAADALGRIKHVSAVPHLVNILQDESPGVRSAAARSLGEIGRSLQDKKVKGKKAKALQFISPYFHEREDPDVIRQAYEAALKGRVTPANARLYVKQLRAMAGNLK